MESTQKAEGSSYFKDFNEAPTLLLSPNSRLDRSTVDVSNLSIINSSLFISPSPKNQLFNDPLSPIQSPIPKRQLRRGPKSHTALEQKLMKIETEHSKSFIQDESYESPFKNHSIAIRVEDDDAKFYSKNIEIPKLAWCAFCGGERATKVKYVNDSSTFWSSVTIFLSGGVFGCFMLPYMSTCCKGVQLVCSQCERVVG